MPKHRDRYLELLLERISEDQYPSGELMDRAEAAMTRPEHLAAYLDVLLEKVDETWYPSKQMLDRIARLAPA
jgi:ubiquinone biosynthesis protein COQ9